ncbi:MAG: organomercurial lyase [Gaiellaceae bacterium]
MVAFHGLSLRLTRNVVEMDGRTLYALCAGDGLFIHDLLGRPARVRSTDPITGETLSLFLEDSRVREAEPSTAVLSMPWPDGPFGDLVGDDLIPAVCGPINVFGSEEAGREFTERTAGIFLLTIEEGLELFRLINRGTVRLGSRGRRWSITGRVPDDDAHPATDRDL